MEYELIVTIDTGATVPDFQPGAGSPITEDIVLGMGDEQHMGRIVTALQRGDIRVEAVTTTRRDVTGEFAATVPR